jgi:hypothetical protein
MAHSAKGRWPFDRLGAGRRQQAEDMGKRGDGDNKGTRRGGSGQLAGGREWRNVRAEESGGSRGQEGKINQAISPLLGL